MVVDYSDPAQVRERRDKIMAARDVLEVEMRMLDKHLGVLHSDVLVQNLSAAAQDTDRLVDISRVDITPAEGVESP